MKPCVLVCNINNLFGNFTMIYLLFLKELPFFVPFINGIGNFKTVWLQADTPQRFANTRSTEIPESKTQCDTNTPILVSLKVNIVGYWKYGPVLRALTTTHVHYIHVQLLRAHFNSFVLLLGYLTHYTRKHDRAVNSTLPVFSTFAQYVTFTLYQQFQQQNVFSYYNFIDDILNQ